MLLLHVQKRDPSRGDTIVSFAYATNKTLKEGIALLNEYNKLVHSIGCTMLLSVSEIGELSADELKSMRIELIEGILEALKNHRLAQNKGAE